MATPLSSSLEWSIANDTWAQSLNPLIANPVNSTRILKNITLVAGANIINHGLGHLMNGWFLVDLQGPVVPYRSAPLNALTLTLTVGSQVTCNIGVF